MELAKYINTAVQYLKGSYYATLEETSELDQCRGVFASPGNCKKTRFIETKTENDEKPL